MKAKSIQGKSVEEIKAGLTKSLADGFTPTLATVFMSAKLDYKAVTELLDSKDIEIFGATTEIAFTDDGTINDGIVILLMDMNKSHFKIVLSDFDNGKAKETAGQIAKIGKNTFSNPAYIISGSLGYQPGELLSEGIIEKIGNDVSVIGGIAGDVVSFTGILFTNGKSCTQGIISLIVDNDKIDIKGIAVSGFKPVGTEKVVTKSEGPWIQSIDNKPAMEVLWQFFGREIEESKISDSLVALSTAYPLQFKRKVGKPIMRPTIMYNTETKAVFCGITIKEGSAFRFSLPPDFDVVDSVVESSTKIRETELKEADAVLVFSCVGRLEILGPMAEQENEGIAKTWDKPMAGFFSLGEFGTVQGGEFPEFHGGTCSWLALKEK